MSHITQIITQPGAQEGRGEDDWRSLQPSPAPLPVLMVVETQKDRDLICDQRQMLTKRHL